MDKIKILLLALVVCLGYLSCKVVESDNTKGSETIANQKEEPEESKDRAVEPSEGLLNSVQAEETPLPEHEEMTISDPPAESIEKYPSDKMIKKSSVSSAMMSEKGEPVTKIPGASPEPGQITAGEWNDLHNWEAWKELLKNQDFNEMQGYWEIYPSARYSVFLTNEHELPLQDAQVDLMDEAGHIIWKARTDNAGKAELWSGLFDVQRDFSKCDIRIQYNSVSTILEDARSIEEGVNHVVIDMECRTPANVDILLVVDATGSMGDEIRYLQSELRDVISRVENGHRSINLRSGAVFYRDHEDEYLTATQALSSDHSLTLDFIGSQYAKGGGDYPEAVDEALKEALAQDWDELALTKIIFLLLDAPPHHKPVEMERIKNQIKDAAAEGIKIIPITASGINRQTEFLMKFMAMITNGTYVFITDHSGIGGSHLDPVIEDYKVEKLNDLMVRLIYNYSKTNGCNPNEIQSSDIRLYPNPASDFVTVQSGSELIEIQVLSNSGQTLVVKKDLTKGENKVDMTGLVDGVYTIRCIGENIEVAKSVILINS